MKYTIRIEDNNREILAESEFATAEPALRMVKSFQAIEGSVISGKFSAQIVKEYTTPLLQRTPHQIAVDGDLCDRCHKAEATMPLGENWYCETCHDILESHEEEAADWEQGDYQPETK